MNETNGINEIPCRNLYKEIDANKFDELKELTEKSDKYVAQLTAKGKKRDIKRGIFPKYKELYEWVLSIQPMCLSNDIYSLPTKIFWILNGITDWNDPKIRCRNCGKPFIGKNVINLYTGYHVYCSLSCAGKSQDVNARKRENSMAKYGVAHPSMLTETIDKVKNAKLEKYGDKNWNNTRKAKTTRLSKFNGKYAPSDYAEKCKKTHTKNGHSENWNNRVQATQTRYAKNKGKYESAESKAKRKLTCIKKFGYDTNLQSEDTKLKSAQTCMRKYGVEHYNQSEEFKRRSAETMLKKYGCRHSTQNAEIQHKAKRRYLYNGTNFDTMPELAYFIWLNDHNINFEYHPKKFFEYSYAGFIRRYFPDFRIGDLFIEIKGDQFFKPDGTMFCPFRKKNQTDEEYKSICNMYEAKHQCMIANNVKILKSKDYQIYLKYIDKKYGRNYLKQFRKQKT